MLRPEPYPITLTMMKIAANPTYPWLKEHVNKPVLSIASEKKK